MKALVGVRPTPHRVESDNGGLATHRWGLAPSDRVAVEAALQTASTVVLVGVGGDRAAAAVRAGLRMGADEGRHVRYDPIEPAASPKYARALAAMAAREDASVVCTGMAVGEMGGELPALVGERTGWPSVSRVTALGADGVDVPVDGDGLPVQRVAGVGEQAVLAVDPPVVLGIDSGFANPRRGALATAMAAGTAEVPTLDLEALLPDESRFSMHLGPAVVSSVAANDRWGRGDPPVDGRVDERIAEMFGRSGAGTGGAEGERVTAPPEDAAAAVVEYLADNDLL
jgi:electron transfer flavoprotein beta subunit